MIRDLEHNDVSKVCELGAGLHYNFSSIYDYNSLNSGVNKTYVLELNTIVIGFVHIQLIQDEVNIIDIVVDNKQRNKGYGKKMLEFLFNKYESCRFFLEVSENNEAKNFYKKYGFKQVGVRKAYYNGVDALLMER